MRKFLRSIARARMEKKGIRHKNKTRQSVNPITKRPVTLPSYFAENWRKYVNTEPKN